MSLRTTNYELIKPELTDAADITATNGNWDKIDSELANKVNYKSNCGWAQKSIDSKQRAILSVVSTKNENKQDTLIPKYTSDLTNDSGFAKVTYGTEDLTAGESELETGTLYFVYE
jgi:hypothetical protein